MPRTALFPFVLLLLLAVLTTTPSLARKNRAQRAIADLDCWVRYQDSLREADQLRGKERDDARKAAHRAYKECRKKAKGYTASDSVFAPVRAYQSGRLVLPGQ